MGAARQRGHGKLFGPRDVYLEAKEFYNKMNEDDFAEYDRRGGGNLGLSWFAGGLGWGWGEGLGRAGQWGQMKTGGS